MEKLLEQARGLSSGTLASLTGLSRYVQIDAIRLDFIEFCEENPHMEKWPTAWNAFWPIYQTTAEYRKIKEMHFEDDPKPMPIEAVAQRKASKKNNKTAAQFPLLASTNAIPDDWLTTAQQEQQAIIQQRQAAEKQMECLRKESAKAELRAFELREEVKALVDEETFAGYLKRVSTFDNHHSSYRIEFWGHILAKLDPSKCPHASKGHYLFKSGEVCPICLVKVQR